MVEHYGLVSLVVVVGADDHDAFSAKEEGIHILYVNTALGHKTYYIGCGTNLIDSQTHSVDVAYGGVDFLLTQYLEGFLCVTAYQTEDAEAVSVAQCADDDADAIVT